MVNINKLRGKMVEREVNVEKLAGFLGVDRATLYRKLSANGEVFTIKEANLICKALDLSAQEAMSIFFSHYVA